MAKCSFAHWRPLPENLTEPFIDADQFVFHTQVGYFGGLYSWFGREDVYVESHFGLSMGGYLEQYIDTARQADAQYRGNLRALSLECEDKGNPSNPYSDPQLEMMVRLGRWAMKAHPAIGKRKCRNWLDPGFGWHSMWGAPSNWTPVRGKTCPGSVRIRQLEIEVFPELFKDQVRLSVTPLALVVKDINGIDAGLAHALQSRISSLIGIEIPVLEYKSASSNIGHVIIVGDTRDLNPKGKWDSVTIYQGSDRIDSGKLIDKLLGGSPL